MQIGFYPLLWSHSLSKVHYIVLIIMIVMYVVLLCLMNTLTVINNASSKFNVWVLTQYPSRLTALVIRYLWTQILYILVVLICQVSDMNPCKWKGLLLKLVHKLVWLFFTGRFPVVQSIRTVPCKTSGGIKTNHAD